jgi:hypothetical protein
MASVRHEIVIGAPPEHVWDVLRDVGAVHERLLPGRVADSRIEDGQRLLTFPDGHVIRELIVAVDDGTRRALGERMHLAFVRVGELLRTELPVDEEQARALLKALGEEDGSEVERGIRLYGKAARAERDRAAADTGPSAWWLRSGYIGQVGDIAPLELLGRQGEMEELAGWYAGGRRRTRGGRPGRGRASPR